MEIEDLKEVQKSDELTIYELDLGLLNDVQLFVQGPSDRAVLPESLLETLNYVQANQRNLHERSRKLIFDFVHTSANEELSAYEFDVAGDWDLLEILEDGDDATLIEEYIHLDRLEFSNLTGECLIHYDVAWDREHGIYIRLEGQSLKLL